MRKLLTGCLTWVAAVPAFLLCLSVSAVAQTPSTPRGASSLLETYASLTAKLSNSQFRRPLVIESSESSQRVDGSVYAVLESPFVEVSQTLKSPVQWCEVMILHLNTKYCRAAADTVPTRIKVSVGRKTPQKLEDAFALDFGFNVASTGNDYFEVTLNAVSGPLGTSDYRIELQAVPVAPSRTFVRLNYAYGYGVASRVAMQGYLSTLGSGKVGFTEVSTGGKSGYIGGMRGAAERNIMRYYLAIEAYQASLIRPRPDQLGARLGHWFDATEEFPRQLREINRSDYLSMKQDEYERQRFGKPQK